MLEGRFAFVGHDRKVADMAGDNHGIEKTQDAQAQEDLGQQQAAQEQSQVRSTDWWFTPISE